MPKIVTAVLLVALVTIPSSRANADPVVLDQNYAPPPTIGLRLGEGISFAQTFTVGIGGTLAGVTLFLFPPGTVTGGPSGVVPGNLIFDVRRTVGGVPVDSDGAALARVAISAADVAPPAVSAEPSAVFFDTSSFGVSVTSGEVLAWVLQNPAPVVGERPAYDVAGNGDARFTAGYCCGAAFARDVQFHPEFSSDEYLVSRELTDLLFQTYVEEAAATPEPATLLLLAVGLAVARQRFSRRPH
jgi:PEP-CTERM motif